MKKPENCYSVPEMCALLDTHFNTLQRWRNLGTGPRWFRPYGRHIFYPKAEVDAWMLGRRLQVSTSENDLGVTQRKRT